MTSTNPQLPLLLTTASMQQLQHKGNGKGSKTNAVDFKQHVLQVVSQITTIEKIL